MNSVAEEFPKPYSLPCVERENVFEFAEKPAVKALGNDKYEITFAVKGNCDVTVGIVGDGGKVIRHLGSGVLGGNAPLPFQKNSLKQTIYWNGKDDVYEYPKEPGKLRVRVSLGLKPVFDKRLGGTSPKNLPGSVLGMALAEDGAYAFIKGNGTFGHATLRKFDHDGNYVGTLIPPPADIPLERMPGMGLVEYEPGKRILQSVDIADMVSGEGYFLPGMNSRDMLNVRPAIAGGRLYYLNGGSAFYDGRVPSLIYHANTDGSTEPAGLKGRPFSPDPRAQHLRPRLAASPDGKFLYMVGLTGMEGGGTSPVVLRRAVDGDAPAGVFAGKATQDRQKFLVGHDNESFNNPVDVACDAAGRVYVADNFNSRVQILSPEGKWLKTIPADRPRCLAVDRKTGAIYVLHAGEVKGRSVTRLTKFTSFDNSVEEFHIDNFMSSGQKPAYGVSVEVPCFFELDSWLPKPRLWVVDGQNGMGITIWEEEGKGLKRLTDFDEEAKKDAGENYIGRWSGEVFDHVNCDPVREQLYFRGFRGNPIVFDLPTGKKLKWVQMPGAMNDFCFDKRGYMHCHMDPGFWTPGVVRLDPAQASVYVDGLGGKHPGTDAYREVPYDYGIPYEYKEHEVLRGILPVKDQPGAKFFQDGFGVNMIGDAAEQCNIYHIPRMDEEGFKAAFAGRLEHAVTKGDGAEWMMRNVYPQYVRGLQERLKRGEEIYSLPRRPGQAMAGATIWTFDRSGEVRKESAVIAGGTMAGVQMDEDGSLYFVAVRTKLFGGKAFLAGRGGSVGAAKPLFPHNLNPMTSTLLKTRGTDVPFILKNAVVPADPLPGRPADLAGDGGAWVEGAEWLYAGASPTKADGCTCASQRFHLDWFKRSYVPESYRRSIGILDTNGNLIMHLGRGGNYDDALRMKAGTQDIALTLPRFISGTDNYLCFDDWGERLVVLKLNYHAEETVGIGEVMSAK